MITHTTRPDALVAAAPAQARLSQVRRIVLSAAGVLLFAVATGIAAQMRIPVAGSPVPMTLQTLVVLLAGVVLGPRLGALSMLFYLALGISGHHVFALSAIFANAGFAYLLGPTGGYLAAFVPAAALVGWMTRRADGSPARRATRIAIAALAGHVVIFALGVGWLRLWAGGDWSAALAAGLFPFIGATLVKCAAAVPLGMMSPQTLR